jgi:hypothetical protein
MPGSLTARPATDAGIVPIPRVVPAARRYSLGFWPDRPRVRRLRGVPA